MKQEEQEDIVGEVKSGQFFAEALDWYNQIYIYPVIQRTSLISITIICIFINVTAYYALYKFLPLIKKFQVGVVNPDETEYYAEVIKLHDPVLTEKEVVFEYMAKFYVTSRETYSFNDLQRNLDVVKNMSSKQVYENYSKYMNINNPSSPILRYRQEASVTISNPQFIIEPGDPKKTGNRIKAKVYFDRLERSGVAAKNERWVATMVFTSGSFDYDQTKKTFPNPNFKVIDYKVAVAQQQRAAQPQQRAAQPAGAQKAQ